MAGWLVVQGTRGGVEARWRRFRSTFTVEGVPPLRTRMHTLGESLHVVLWAWSDLGTVDLHEHWNDDRRELLLADGYLLRTSRTHRDDGTVSLLGGWRAGRDALLRTLSGSFALVHLDGAAGTFTVVTDRIASRAVWLFEHPTGHIAGNFPAAIAAMSPEPPRISPAGLWALFATARPVGRQGLFAGMRSLRGGEIAIAHAAAERPVSVARWRTDRYRPERRTAGEWGEAIGETLARSAERLVAVTPNPKLFLSGGLDSRLAAAALSRHTTTVTLTSSGNNGNVRAARRVAESVGARHQVIDRADDWYLEAFPAAALIAGGNYALSHAHYMAPVRLIRASEPDASFLLGDMLENFNKHYFKANGERPAFVPSKIPHIYPRLYSYAHPEPVRLRRLLRPGFALAAEDAWRTELIDFCETLQDVSDDDGDRFDTLFRWSNCGLCPTNLMLQCIRPLASDRNLMFDGEMLDLYLRVPAAMRGRGSLHLATLRFFGMGLSRIPDSNYWLPPGAPAPLKRAACRIRPVLGRFRRRLHRLRRPSGAVVATSGSWHRLDEWFRRDERHRNFVESLIRDDACWPDEIFDRGAVTDVWRDFLAGGGRTDRATVFELHALIAFGLLQRKIPTYGSGC